MATTTTKLTKRDFFTAMIDFITEAQIEKIKNIPSAEVTEFLKHQIDLLDKKSGADRKPTKTQVENEKIKAVIIEILKEENRPLTATEITKTEKGKDYSLNKVVALLSQLVKAGAVCREMEKRTPYFTIA